MKLWIGAILLGTAMCAAAQTATPAPTASTASNPNTVRITSGPTVEYAGSDRAIIAWSTNVSSGTVVRYGQDENNLSQVAKMPWGSLTHRVTIKNLHPGTHYFFQVQSGDAAGSGTSIESAVLQFDTKTATAATQQPSAK